MSLVRREIAEAMARRYEYFSTFAGSPVSAVAALATMDVLEDQRLPHRALRTGRYLRSELRAYGSTVDWIGSVRGRGLLAGVEVSPSPDSGITAKTVAEGLRRERVLIGVTGRARNVLKIRPPLVWDESHVDHLMAALRRVGSEIDGRQR